MSLKRLIVAAIATTSVVLSPDSLRAQVAVMNGNALYGNCTTLVGDSHSVDMHQAICLFYVDAVVDVLSVNAINGFKACIPSTANIGQIMDVVKSFLRDHPEKRHHVAAGLVAEALATAFPCQRMR